MPCQGTVAEEASAQQFPEKTREEKKYKNFFLIPTKFFKTTSVVYTLIGGLLMLYVRQGVGILLTYSISKSIVLAPCCALAIFITQREIREHACVLKCIAMAKRQYSTLLEKLGS